MGCPCHFLHNTAHKGAKEFETVCGFDVEEMAVDVFYYFDHSTKRKGEFREYAQFCDIEYHKMLKYVSTRWLSLQTSIERMLKQYSALRSYFLSQDENESDRRLSRLQGLLNDPMTEVNLLFYQSVLPVFTKSNLLLQRDSPCIHFLYDAMERVLRTLLGRLVTVTAMDSANTVVEVDFNSKSNQLIDSQLIIGFTTKQVLARVQDEVQPSKVKKYYNGVRAFYVKCLTYIVDKFAWNDPLLKHVQFVDFEKRKNVPLSRFSTFSRDSLNYYHLNTLMRFMMNFVCIKAYLKFHQN